MQKWEYLTATAEGHIRNDPVVLQVDYDLIGVKQEGFLAGTKYPKLTDFLKNLGAEGWELVSVIREERIFQYIFKRPRL